MRKGSGMEEKVKVLTAEQQRTIFEAQAIADNVGAVQESRGFATIMAEAGIKAVQDVHGAASTLGLTEAEALAAIVLQVRYMRAAAEQLGLVV